MAYVQLNDGLIIETDSPDIWTEGKRLKAAEGRAALKAQAIERLHKILQPGDTVDCIVRHVSRSGMYRVIDFYKFGKDGEREYLSGLMLAAGVGERPRGRAEGVGMGGCGMDMGFAAVYELGATLWPNGTPQPHGRRNGEPDRDGGYALKHRWI